MNRNSGSCRFSEIVVYTKTVNMDSASEVARERTLFMHLFFIGAGYKSH